MKKLWTLVAVLPLTWVSFAQTKFEKKIDALLSKMTVEEKVGQMTQVDLSVVFNKDTKEVDPAKLKECIKTYHVGSILNSNGNAFELEKWHRIVKQVQDEALSDRMKIPVIYGIDAIHGVTYTKNSTLFPHNIALGATRNTDLAATAAEVTTKECRASGLRWNFDPVLDIGRQPLWPRFPETFGEDPYIIGEMGEAMIKAYEKDGLDSPTAVASCMKHYVGYSAPATGKDRTPAFIPDVILWEYYLPQFKKAVDAGASTIMINSASINGMPVHASKKLLTGILRDSLGFKGLIVTDWEDIIRLHTRHRVAETPKEAVRIAIEAGIDMSMVPNNYSFFTHLVALVKEGSISEKRIDESVRIILRLKYQLGLFDNAYVEKKAIKNFGLKEYRVQALDAARQAMTLLKNDNNALPLSKDKKVLIAGPSGNALAPLNGSWSYSWQGNVEENYPEDYKTIYEAVAAKIGKDNVNNISGTNFNDLVNYDTELLSQEAQKADVIILCLGENAYAESPGSIDDLMLPKKQLELAKAAYATGKPVIMVLNEGRPRILSEIVPGADAILMAYQSGSMAADAIADVVFGDYNPGGVLPYTYPRFTGDIVMYDRICLSDIQRRTVNGLSTNGYYPQWPFGHGLSYTTFEFSDIKLSANEITASDKLTVEVTVKNTGKLKGDKVVDLYITDEYASLSPRVKKLKRFKRVTLDAGASETVKFELNVDDLKFYNLDLKRIAEKGAFTITIGDKKAKFNLK